MSLYLRCWVGLVGFTALANSVQCLLKNQFPRDRIYTAESHEASQLAGRLFGVWTLLAAFVRIAFAFSTPSTSLYLLVLISFVLALYHFTSEVFIYKTAPIATPTILPLIISGLSTLWMSIEFIY